MLYFSFSHQIWLCHEVKWSYGLFFLLFLHYWLNTLSFIIYFHFNETIFVFFNNTFVGDELLVFLHLYIHLFLVLSRSIMFLSWQFFTSNTWIMFHFLLAPRVSDEKYFSFWIGIPLYVICKFFWLLSRFFLVFIIRSLITMCLDIVTWDYLCRFHSGSWIYRFTYFTKFWEVFFQFFFKYSLKLFLSFSYLLSLMI